MAVQYTKSQYKIQNGHKLYQNLPLQSPPKFNQIGNFGLKKYHLATMVCARICSSVKSETICQPATIYQMSTYPETKKGLKS
jgi:hypothetical protein